MKGWVKTFGCAMLIVQNLAASSHAENFGAFLDELNTKWLPGGRDMELLSDYRYRDPGDVIWTAKAGATVNGASIPPSLWSVIGSPFVGLYRNASVVHDYYCDHHLRDWKATHRAFYFAMRASGVSDVQAKIMYFAVYAFGPRWQETVRHSVSRTCVERADGACVAHERKSVALITTSTEKVAIYAEQQARMDAYRIRLLNEPALDFDQMEKDADMLRQRAEKLPPSTSSRTESKSVIER